MVAGAIALLVSGCGAREPSALVNVSDADLSIINRDRLPPARAGRVAPTRSARGR
jgi:hypothetical protein